MTKKFKIVDSVITTETNGALKPRSWEAFRTSEDAQAEVRMRWDLAPVLTYGVRTLEPSGRARLLQSGGTLLCADSDWTDVTLYSVGNGQKTDADDNSLLILAVYSYLIPRRTLLFHSSLVDWQGCGILFLGPSGIGKTTQAELWNRYAGAEILNGDLVFVREREDGFYADGSPWHGSSPDERNARVKVKALVKLEQSPDNSLRLLSGFEVMQDLMDQLFLPHWYPETMDACLDTFDSLLANTPVYRLSCRPTEDAVILLKNELSIK